MAASRYILILGCDSLQRPRYPSRAPSGACRQRHSEGAVRYRGGYKQTFASYISTASIRRLKRPTRRQDGTYFRASGSIRIRRWHYPVWRRHGCLGRVQSGWCDGQRSGRQSRKWLFKDHADSYYKKGTNMNISNISHRESNRCRTGSVSAACCALFHLYWPQLQKTC